MYNYEAIEQFGVKRKQHGDVDDCLVSQGVFCSGPFTGWPKQDLND